MRRELYAIRKGGVRVRFVRAFYAPRGTVPLHAAGDRDVFPGEIARALVDSGFAKEEPLSAEERAEIAYWNRSRGVVDA